jgi:hypothetical protein
MMSTRKKNEKMSKIIDTTTTATSARPPRGRPTSFVGTGWFLGVVSLLFSETCGFWHSQFPMTTTTTNLQWRRARGTYRTQTIDRTLSGGWFLSHTHTIVAAADSDTWLSESFEPRSALVVSR